MSNISAEKGLPRLYVSNGLTCMVKLRWSWTFTSYINTYTSLWSLISTAAYVSCLYQRSKHFLLRMYLWNILLVDWKLLSVPLNFHRKCPYQTGPLKLFPSFQFYLNIANCYTGHPYFYCSFWLLPKHYQFDNSEIAPHIREGIYKNKVIQSINKLKNEVEENESLFI